MERGLHYGSRFEGVIEIIQAVVETARAIDEAEEERI